MRTAALFVAGFALAWLVARGSMALRRLLSRKRGSPEAFAVSYEDVKRVDEQLRFLRGDDEDEDAALGGRRRPADRNVPRLPS